MKNEVKIILIVCSVILGVCGIALTVHIWQTTPFFDMNLVFLDVVLFLLMAALLAIAMMSSSD